MNQSLTFIVILFFSLNACKQKAASVEAYSFRDSVVKEYVTIADSTDQYDTTEVSYKILKSYISNDTVSLKKLQSGFINIQKLNDQWSLFDSCIHQRKLQTLNIDTGYRFIYGMAFCPYEINATVTKLGDSAKLNFILYQPKCDTAECRIISEFDKSLPKKSWDDLMSAIEKSDFWGLKKDNGVHGVDGDGLTMIGYIKADSRFSRPAKYSYVYRWGLYSTSLHDPFHLVLKISGNKKGCIWAQ